VQKKTAEWMVECANHYDDDEVQPLLCWVGDHDNLLNFTSALKDLGVRVDNTRQLAVI